MFVVRFGIEIHTIVLFLYSGTEFYRHANVYSYVSSIPIILVSVFPYFVQFLDRGNHSSYSVLFIAERVVEMAFRHIFYLEKML